MCNPDNSAKAAPFLFLADALFTLLTVKVILFVVSSVFVIGRIVDVLLIVALFCPKIVVFINCSYSIFMLMLLLFYRFLFSSVIITFLQAVPHFNIDFESYMQQVIGK